MQSAEDPGMVDYDEDTITPVNPNAPIIEVVDTPVFVPEGVLAHHHVYYKDCLVGDAVGTLL